MGERNSWPTPAHEWLLCQWSHVNSMLALLRDSGVALEEVAQASNELLSSLRRHHGGGDEPALLIDDPFGERHVSWTIADICLLVALSKRAEASAASWPHGLVDCLVDLLRQFCLVTARSRSHAFAAVEFMSDFPAGIMHAAFFRLTPQEQGLVLVRVYPEHDTEGAKLIEIFARNKDVDRDERLFVLGAIWLLTQRDSNCRELAHELVDQLNRNEFE